MSSSFANALSNKCTDGSTAACSPTENFYVRSLAAGGPTAGPGSQVIYAGMSSGQSAGNPVGGNVFVTTNAIGGPTTWMDRTGTINPKHYPVSSIAIDPSDPTGNTAYLTIMGFSGGPTGHVFKTTNAGVSWTDITNGLPDAPANSIIIDPRGSSAIYVGTDVGVFISEDGGDSWNPFGQGLPNVDVTALHRYSYACITQLRTSHSVLRYVLTS